MFCKNCGRELVPGAKFCSECGTKVSEETTYIREDVIEEPMSAEDAFKQKVSFDWSNVIDEPQRKEVSSEIKSPWAAAPDTDDVNVTEPDSGEAEDISRTMSFIDVIKADKEEREKAVMDKSIEYTEVLEIDPELLGGTKPPALHMAPLYDDVDEPVKTPFDDYELPQADAEERAEKDNLTFDEIGEGNDADVEETITIEEEKSAEAQEGAAPKFELPDFLKKAVGFVGGKDDEPEVIPPVGNEAAESDDEITADDEYREDHNESVENEIFDDLTEDTEDLYLDLEEDVQMSGRMSRVTANTLAGIYDLDDEEDDEEGNDNSAEEDSNYDKGEDESIEDILFKEIEDSSTAHSGMTIAAPAEEEGEIEELKKRLADLTGTVEIDPALLEDEETAEEVTEIGDAAYEAPELGDDFTFEPEITAADDELFAGLTAASRSVSKGEPDIEIEDEPQAENDAKEVFENGMPEFDDFTFEPEITAADDEFFAGLTAASKTLPETHTKMEIEAEAETEIGSEGEPETKFDEKEEIIYGLPDFDENVTEEVKFKDFEEEVLEIGDAAYESPELEEPAERKEEEEAVDVSGVGAYSGNIEFAPPVSFMPDSQKEAFEKLNFDVPSAPVQTAIYTNYAEDEPKYEEPEYEESGYEELKQEGPSFEKPVEEPVKETKPTDAMSLSELEKDLFGENAGEEAEAETTKKIDKFYTLYRKNEEFQRLLDEEYSRLRGDHIVIPEDEESSSLNTAGAAAGMGSGADDSSESIEEDGSEEPTHQDRTPVESVTETVEAEAEAFSPGVKEEARPVEDATIYQEMPKELADLNALTSEELSVESEGASDRKSFGLGGGEALGAAAAAGAAVAAVKASEKESAEAETGDDKNLSRKEEAKKGTAEVEYEDVDAGSTILTILAVIIAILLVLLLIAILILHLDPTGAAGQWIENLIGRFTSNNADILINQRLI